MRNKIVIGVMGVLLSCGGLAQAVGITFTSNGTIDNPQVWDYVDVRNDGTVVNMFGGQAGGLDVRDASIFNMSNGQITGTINIDPPSTINVSDGVINLVSDFVVRGIANLYDGDITAHRLKTYPDSIVNINGGSLNFDYFDIRGIVNVRSGSLDVKNTGAGFDSIINVYGYGFNYDPSGGTFYDGKLTGYLLDNSPFTFDNLNEYGYSQFNLIPEPTTIFLVGMGGLFLRRKA